MKLTLLLLLLTALTVTTAVSTSKEEKGNPESTTYKKQVLTDEFTLDTVLMRELIKKASEKNTPLFITKTIVKKDTIVETDIQLKVIHKHDTIIKYDTLVLTKIDTMFQLDTVLRREIRRRNRGIKKGIINNKSNIL
jgi:hypothetical protein|tara:strand:+ start:2351 stop:2761 length:411 start_codon:yes stop_codon:yes gene_type:complete